ncbi:MAG: PhnD/SsuA/transferrin family substrate-binding protein, partial [Oribacterium sp.]
MKRLASVLLAAAVGASLLTACGGSGAKTGTEAPKSSEAEASKGTEAAGESKGETKKLDSLKIAFVPSREPQEIVTATEPLKGLLQEELSKQGYEVKDVDITVGTNFEAVGEGLEAGTIDVGFIPGGTYVLYSDGAEVLLTATRDGLSI